MANPSDYVPVGAILAYAADDVSPLKSVDWALCDGTTLNTTEYPDLFRVLGYTNGGSDAQFNLPDFRGYFLRGAIGDVGRITPYTTGLPKSTATVSLAHVPGDAQAHHGNKGALPPAAKNFAIYNDDDQTLTVTGSDKESRPVNVAFNWIIKIRPTPFVPVGAVTAFAGSTDSAPDDNWSFCNGAQLKQASAKALYKVLGKRFSTSIDPFFNLPDLTGQFLRGSDDGTQRDPDGNSRTAPDGTVGPVVGTDQGYATGDPVAGKFSATVAHYITSSEKEYIVTGYNCLVKNNVDTNGSFSGGDNETRPANVYMDYYVQQTTNDGTFPVGLIAAFSSQIPPPDDRWALCNGQEQSISGPFSDLYEVTGNIHGSTSPETFNLPNLTAKFIRGADYTANGQPGVDPDRFKRQAPFGGASTGPGSLQDWATARAKNWAVSAVIHTESHEIAKTAVGYNFAEWILDSNAYAIAGGDTETKPLSASVDFYVKYRV